MPLVGPAVGTAMRKILSGVGSPDRPRLRSRHPAARAMKPVVLERHAILRLIRRHGGVPVDGMHLPAGSRADPPPAAPLVACPEGILVNNRRPFLAHVMVCPLQVVSDSPRINHRESQRIVLRKGHCPGAKALAAQTPSVVTLLPYHLESQSPAEVIRLNRSGIALAQIIW